MPTVLVFLIAFKSILQIILLGAGINDTSLRHSVGWGARDQIYCVLMNVYYLLGLQTGFEPM